MFDRFYNFLYCLYCGHPFSETKLVSTKNAILFASNLSNNFPMASNSVIGRNLTSGFPSQITSPLFYVFGKISSLRQSLKSSVKNLASISTNFFKISLFIPSLVVAFLLFIPGTVSCISCIVNSSLFSISYFVFPLL